MNQTTNEIISACKHFDEYAFRLINHFDIKSEDPKGILASALYLKIESLVQAILVLAEKGLIEAIKSIARTLIELLLYLKMNLEKDNFGKELLNSDNRRREKLYKNLLRYPKIFKEARSKIPNIQPTYMGLKKQNQTQNSKMFSLKDLALDTKLEDEYFYFYTYLCGEDHVHINNLLRKAKIGNDKIVAFDLTEDLDDIKCLRILLLTIYRLLFLAIGCIKEEYIKIDISKDLKYYEDVCEKLYEKI